MITLTARTIASRIASSTRRKPSRATEATELSSAPVKLAEESDNKVKVAGELKTAEATKDTTVLSNNKIIKARRKTRGTRKRIQTSYNELRSLMSMGTYQFEPSANTAKIGIISHPGSIW